MSQLVKDKPQGNRSQRDPDGESQDRRLLKHTNAAGKGNAECQGQHKCGYDQVPQLFRSHLLLKFIA